MTPPCGAYQIDDWKGEMRLAAKKESCENGRLWGGKVSQATAKHTELLPNL